MSAFQRLGNIEALMTASGHPLPVNSRLLDYRHRTHPGIKSDGSFVRDSEGQRSELDCRFWQINRT
jgi:hypothetical protein